MPSPEEMQKRYENMIDKEDQALDETLPPGARERENAARAAAQKVVAAAHELMKLGRLEAVGYRILVKPLEGVLGLEDAEAEVAPTLFEAGFQSKTDAQLKREDRGEHFGIIISMGGAAFLAKGGPEAWGNLGVGSVVIFSRYAGERVEHPKGSGNFYQLMNDEDIYGKVQ